MKNTNEIKLYGINEIADMSYMFYNCKLLKSLPDFDRIDTSKITNIEYLFFGCESLESLPDLSKWNTSNIINMKYSPNTEYAAMICFIEKIPENIANINQIILKLNNYLKNKNVNTLKSLEHEFDYIYKSLHERTNHECIDLTHLFFDYTHIVT